jgi:hypothetical protein
MLGVVFDRGRHIPCSVRPISDEIFNRGWRYIIGIASPQATTYEDFRTGHEGISSTPLHFASCIHRKEPSGGTLLVASCNQPQRQASQVNSFRWMSRCRTVIPRCRLFTISLRKPSSWQEVLSLATNCPLTGLLRLEASEQTVSQRKPPLRRRGPGSSLKAW